MYPRDSKSSKEGHKTAKYRQNEKEKIRKKDEKGGNGTDKEKRNHDMFSSSDISKIKEKKKSKKRIKNEFDSVVTDYRSSCLSGGCDVCVTSPSRLYVGPGSPSLSSARSDMPNAWFSTS